MADAQIPVPATAEDTAAEQRRARRGTFITLGVLAMLVAMVVLLTPVQDNASNDTELTTIPHGPGNAKLAADLARRLGWRVQTRTVPLTGTLDSTVIYAVFGGPTAMAPSERAAVQSAVQRGAGLLLASTDDDAFRLPSALGLRVGKAGSVTATPLGSCPPENDAFATLRSRPRMLTYDTALSEKRRRAGDVPYPQNARTLLSSAVRIDEEDDDPDAEKDSVAPAGSLATNARRTAADSAALASRRKNPVSEPKTEPQPSVVAFALGRGRVVAMADPDLLRTDQLRSCRMGAALTFVRGLEYLSEGRQRMIVFAEYYQVARSDGPSVVLGEWLRGTGSGRMVLTLMGACVILLLARGRRTLAPVYRVREERRSALEHVDALATAWQAVRGTRTVARMLARGIRRRHAAGRWRSLDDTAFLSALAERYPAIADDAAQLTRAIASPVAPSDLPALRKAAAHIDAECLAP